MALEDFKRLYSYKPELAGFVGVEREAFLAHVTGARKEVTPQAPELLRMIARHGIPVPENGGIRWEQADIDVFGYELSACQIETRTRPVQLVDLAPELYKVERSLNRATKYLGLTTIHTEVAHENMPLDIYPDPSGRYQQLTKDMPIETLRAACRVTGTHIHVGMCDHDSALRVYNHVSRHWRELAEMGNGSFGERLAIYRQMAPNFEPVLYESWDHYYQAALMHGFDLDPRKCWTLIRLSVHGTIEFRMFGSTDNIDRITRWAQACHALCGEVM